MGDQNTSTEPKRLPARRPVAWWVCPALALATLLAPAISCSAPSVRVVASGLTHPWALAFLPDGRFLVSERPGALRVIEADGRVHPPVQGTPAVFSQGQGGLLDLALDQDFAKNRILYFCYAEPSNDGTSAGTALARARLSEDAKRLQSLQVLFRQHPKVRAGNHFGCRIAQGGDFLFLALGERFGSRDQAQTLDNHLGKVVRLRTDGSAPPDNPWARHSGARPELWSIGHRNPQGLVMSPLGELWLHEHGPMGGDEINRPTPGANYGWPLVSHGRNYDGTPVGTAQREHLGTQAPWYTWVPSIAPSGMAFVRSERYGAQWKGTLLVGSLKFGLLVRLELEHPFQGRVVHETRWLQDLGQRVRDVRESPDGYIYLLTDHNPGQLLQLEPGG